MNPFSYFNPVQISFGEECWNQLGGEIKGSKCLIVTSSGWASRGMIQNLEKITNPSYILDTVPSNPDLKYLESILPSLESVQYETVVALGGGSVLDCAKVLSYRFFGGSNQKMLEFLKSGKGPDADLICDLFVIPTTAGTGSEVTPWGTIWDFKEKKKYSIHSPKLWPKSCYLDPFLTRSLPRSLTISGALDAFSHSLESIWNKNWNPISQDHAIQAARTIWKVLPRLLVDLGDMESRSKIQLAATQAGLAFSNTKTAIAHALSYPVTTWFDVPHGIACSFTLPDIVETCLETDSRVSEALVSIFGEEPEKEIRSFFKDIDVPTRWQDYGADLEFLESIKEDVASNPRMSNSLVPLESLFQKWVKNLKS